jgi:hypothetical protein
MPIHYGTLFWFRANQSLLLLRFDMTRLQHTIYHTQGEHTKHYATYKCASKFKIFVHFLYYCILKMVRAIQNMLLYYYTKKAINTINAKTKTHQNWMKNKRLYTFQICQISNQKRHNFIKDHPINIPTKFGSNWLSSFRQY